MPDEERGKVMAIVTSWMEEGIEKGREEGRKDATLQLVLRQSARRLGDKLQTSLDPEVWLSDYASA